MASQADIDFVKSNLPDYAESVGWDDDKISTTIDSLSSTSQTIRSFWVERVNDSTLFTDISESGSSRSLTQVHQNFKDQVTYWDDKIAKEQQFPTNRPRISFGQITLT